MAVHVSCVKFSSENDTVKVITKLNEYDITIKTSSAAIINILERPWNVY